MSESSSKKFFSYTDPNQLTNLVRSHQYEIKIDTKEYWHKFIIIGGSRFQKKDILKALINSVSQNYFIPVMYRVDGENSCFLFQNCSAAVKILAGRGFYFAISPDVKLALNLQMEFCPFTDFPIEPIIEIDKVIIKRINVMERVFDLRNFVNDPDLEELYIPLSCPIVHTTVVNVIKRVLTRPNIILLSHNELTDCNILEILKTVIINLKGLDLRFNKLTWDAFNKLSFLRITDLWLDGNPLCDPHKYSSAYIVEQVKKVFPSLIRLDGIEVTSPPISHVVPLKNYIDNENYASMIDHFLHHYFNLYESPARSQLGRLYHPDSFLSISACHVASETASNHSANKYSKLSRNMLTISDMTRMYDTLKKGPTEIIQTLIDLPFVMFDPFSFQVDVPIIMKKTIVINVCGVFKDFSSFNPGSLFFFDRTFILVPWEPVLGEWRIINDMWAITNTTAAVADASFTQAKKPLTSEFAVMINNKIKDKNLLQRMVAELTKLNGVWTLKFLTDASWNLEMALQSFVDQYKANLIPLDAFTKGSDKMEHDN